MKSWVRPVMSALGLLVSAAGAMAFGITRENKVDFDWAGEGAASLSFVSTGRAVTNGQPWEGISQSQSGQRFTLTIRAGRKASRPVADWFQARLYQGGAIAETLLFNFPDELNFATEGWLTINGSSYRVVIGQGHSGTQRNNWWLGGADLSGFLARNVLSTRDGKYVFRVTGVNRFEVAPSPAHDPDWMERQVADSTSLAELSVPGTHDSATYHMSRPGIDPFGVTQKFSILGQLNMGVRYLDIRLGFTDGTLKTFHGAFDLELTFRQVLEQALDFLHDNPGETVIMAIKKERGEASLIGPIFEELRRFDPSLGRYWLRNDLPEMGDVRGRIVFIDRESCIKAGILIKNWEDDRTFDSNGQVDFRIQDHYDVNKAAYGGIREKLDDVRALINESLTGPTSTWYLNFLSGTAAAALRTTWWVAENVNPPIAETLETTESGRVGTIIVDFAGELSTPAIFRNVIERNVEK